MIFCLCKRSEQRLNMECVPPYIDDVARVYSYTRIQTIDSLKYRTVYIRHRPYSEEKQQWALLVIARRGVRGCVTEAQCQHIARLQQTQADDSDGDIVIIWLSLSRMWIDPMYLLNPILVSSAE